ncbi:6,7-dimethyl-8-ribityllumazine synthase [mine drainage metagenome]|jgi:6,7-dimethyl-8-ribityllumazine synthase|uniref:6,7-dimethyl-8-ribityllumazine synthase n=1 Tax=mine drainage metagenome TaxID=410659 RepID=A0A1J5P9Q4_9ZZZZ
MQNAQVRNNSEQLDGRDLRIAVVQARFNVHLTDRLAQSCLEELQLLGVGEDDIVLHTVPGALELPLALQALAEGGEFDALIALGCVIRGGTYHFELVCNTSAAGIQQVTLDHGIPVANGVLTVEDEEQAIVRLDKGAECARVAVEMANLLIDIGSDEE